MKGPNFKAAAYCFEDSLTENSKHMDNIKKKYKNKKFENKELFGYD